MLGLVASSEVNSSLQFRTSVMKVLGAITYLDDDLASDIGRTRLLLQLLVVGFALSLMAESQERVVVLSTEKEPAPWSHILSVEGSLDL